MHSVWSSLGAGASDGRRDRQPAAAAASASVPAASRARPTCVESIWSQPATVAAPAPSLFHPRYDAGDARVRRGLVQEGRVKPLLISGAFGQAALPDAPHYDAVLWPDSQRTRLPGGPHPDARRLAKHDTASARPGLFNIASEGPAAASAPSQPSYSGSLAPGASAHRPPPAIEAEQLRGLSLANMSTHVPPPEGLMPFATLMAATRPHPLSDAGFRPLLIPSIAQRWNTRLGVPTATEVSGVEEEKEVERPRSDSAAAASAVPTAALAAIPARHDIATSPLPSRTRLSVEAQATYALALSPARPPLPAPAAAAASSIFPPAPPGVNPDAHLTAQAESLHRFSVRALQSQLADLKREGRALERDKREAEKSTRADERRWEELVGGSTGRQREPALLTAEPTNDDDVTARVRALDSPLRHALLLDHEREVETQTDATIGLQHARRPRMAARSGDRSGPLTALDRIDAEVASEFAAKRAVAFGERPPEVVARKKAVAHLPTFESHTDAYRTALREQHRLVFEAQLAAQARVDTPAGQMVEARLKKLREDATWMANPYQHTREPSPDEPTPSPASSSSSSIPPTVIGSRTAALLFVDPQMMLRPVVQPTPSPPVVPEGTAVTASNGTAAGTIPNKVAELTRRTEAALATELGFAVPQATFVDAGTTHRRLRFAERTKADEDEARAAVNTASQPPPINVAELPPVSAYDADGVYFGHPPAENSALDHLGVFAKKPPLQVLHQECADLDADVFRLEQTVRALHVEFARDTRSNTATAEEAKQQQKKADVQQTPLLHPISALEEDEREAASRLEHEEAASEMRRRALAEARRHDKAQNYLDRMDHVLGVPSRPVPRPKQEPLANSSRAATSSYAAPATGASVALTQSSRTPSLQAQRAQGTASRSRLAAALEQYLSIDAGLTDMMRNSLGGGTGPRATNTNTLPLPPPPHDLNRPDAFFTPNSLSPSYQRDQERRAREEAQKHAQQARAREESQAAAAAAAAAQSTRSSYHTPRESWESDLVAADDRPSNRHQEVDIEFSEDPSRHDDFSDHVVSPRATHASHTSRRIPREDRQLSRVPEADHETSRSTLDSSAQTVSAAAAAVALRAHEHHYDRYTGTNNVRESNRGRDPRYADDTSADDESEDMTERSAIIRVDLQQPYRYDDSLDSIRSIPGGSFSPTRRGGGGSGAAQPFPPGYDSRLLTPTSARSSMASSPVATRPSSATGSARASPRGGIASQAPRTTRAAELRAASVAAARVASEAALAHHESLKPKPRRTAMEVERERRRRAAATRGMMQSTREEDAMEMRRSNTSMTHSLSKSQSLVRPAQPQLGSTTERQVAEARALMDDFRALLGDMPSVDQSAESAHAVDWPAPLPPHQESYDDSLLLAHDDDHGHHHQHNDFAANAGHGRITPPELRDDDDHDRRYTYQHASERRTDPPSVSGSWEEELDRHAAQEAARNREVEDDLFF